MNADEDYDLYDQLVDNDPLELRDRCRRADALLRAALLHRAGRADLLLFRTREAFDEVALEHLGYDSIDKLVADRESRRA